MSVLEHQGKTYPCHKQSRHTWEAGEGLVDLCGAVKNLVWKAGPGGQSVRLRATIGEDEESQKERDRVAQ